MGENASSAPRMYKALGMPSDAPIHASHVTAHWGGCCCTNTGSLVYPEELQIAGRSYELPTDSLVYPEEVQIAGRSYALPKDTQGQG